MKGNVVSVGDTGRVTRVEAKKQRVVPSPNQVPVFHVFEELYVRAMGAVPRRRAGTELGS